MDQLLPLLAAFGLGSVVTALVQSALTNRTKRFDRIFAERQVAYVGLWEALNCPAAKGKSEAERSLGYWLARCDLVGSDAVCKTIGPMIKKHEAGEVRLRGDADLRQAMRNDLKVLD